MHAKLYDFNVIDKIIETDEPYTDNKQFIIQAFAKHNNGETILFHIEDFHPFFYVKIPDDWASMMKRKVVNKFKKEMGSYYEHSIIEHECTLEHHKKLYGFDGGRLYKFVKLVFKKVHELFIVLKISFIINSVNLVENGLQVIIKNVCILVI